MNRISNLLIPLSISVFLLQGCQSSDYENGYITGKPGNGSFPLYQKGEVASIIVSSDDFKGVAIAAENLAKDMERVTAVRPELLNKMPESGPVIIAGTLGESPWIDALAEQGVIDAAALRGKWEKFITTPVRNAFPGVKEALVITGSDKRGTIFGLYDLAGKIGVSPWYFWADVPALQQEKLYVKAGIHTLGEPKVKYRGIFINDEAPALAGWVHENYGAFNHGFYEHVFELILRLKGNYLWPAMWGRAFYDDDPMNPVKAEEYGVVIGTSHHEPLMRAHVEWSRYGEGPWNYEENPEVLQEFWREGIERMGDNESIVTIGMRGDGDEPMTEGTAIALLEKIVHDQREIIEEVTGKPASETPQAWALYKEVQDYYDKGMRVPDDVLLLLCDDNWGNIRKLPKAENRNREGGFGIYYHFDYVGGPRNYKWLNTNQIERTWEQMHLAWQYGADRLWIVNVGDIKPMEFPISFFLDYAWDPEAIGPEDLPDYYRDWSSAQFGPEHAEEIGYILARYTKFNARRKPEMLAPETYSLEHYREWERVIREYSEVERRAERIYGEIASEFRDAYFQLVLFPVQACANLNRLYYVTALNRKYAAEKRALTNSLADSAKAFFARDAELTRQYHEDLANGKWNQMMSQTHIGYTSWQEPPVNRIPELASYEEPEEALMGIWTEGAEQQRGHFARNMEFDYYTNQTRRAMIYNQGREPFDFKASADQEWINLSKNSGTVTTQGTLLVSVDWVQLGNQAGKGVITIEGTGKIYEIAVTADGNYYLSGIDAPVFMESSGIVSMDAENYTSKTEGDQITWQFVPNLGKTAGAMTTFPANEGVEQPGGDSPHLGYKVFFKDTGMVNITAYMSPTLNFHASPGRHIALSLDNREPQMVNIHGTNEGWMWYGWVGDNMIKARMQVRVDTPGVHEVKYWLADPGLVVQKLVTDRGNLPRSYLGPPQSFLKKE